MAGAFVFEVMEIVVQTPAFSMSPSRKTRARSQRVR